MAYIYTYVYVYTCVYVFVFIYIYLCLCMYIYIYVYLFMYVCMVFDIIKLINHQCGHMTIVYMCYVVMLSIATILYNNEVVHRTTHIFPSL